MLLLLGRDADRLNLAGKAKAVVEEIKKGGGTAIAVGGDVTADDFPKKLVNATVEYVLRAYWLCYGVIGTKS